MRSSYAPDPWARVGRCCWLFLLMVSASKLEAHEFKNYWKFGLNLGLNEAGVTCKPINQPRDAGMWLSGGNGACPGAWTDLYNSVSLRDPAADGKAWAHIDFNLYINLNGERNVVQEALKMGNSNLFVEIGQWIPRDSIAWFGRRGYRYENLWLIGMTIANSEGPGLGVYNIDLGAGTRGAIAGFYTVSSQGGPMQKALDLRWDEISLLGGKLGLIYVYTATAARDAATGMLEYAPMRGQKIAVMHKAWAPSMSHQFAIMYGQGLSGAVDSTDYERGSLADSFGPWRNNGLYSAGSPPELRDAIQKSATYRIGEQISWYPQGKPFSIDASAGIQRADFGGLHYTVDEDIHDRPDMQSFAAAIRPTLQFKSTLELETLLGYVKVIDGFGYRHRDANGDLQETLQPLDQRLCNLYFSLNLKPLGRWQQKFSLYSGYSWWNRATRRDVSNGLYPERTSGWYSGVGTYWEM